MQSIALSSALAGCNAFRKQDSVRIYHAEHTDPAVHTQAKPGTKRMNDVDAFAMF